MKQSGLSSPNAMIGVASTSPETSTTKKNERTMAVKMGRTASVATLATMPLIDVVFLLVIFFLVASRFVEEERHFELQLPSASESLPLMAQPAELIINIDSQGRHHVGGQLRNAAELQTILQQAAVNNPLTQTVVIRADRLAPWQSVLTAIDFCKQAGITDYTAMVGE